MGSLLYIRLIGYTAGTLLQLFWMVVILGYRRQRNFERVFFFLCLALFFFYGGSLLALNAQIHYSQPPITLTEFAIVLITVGLCFVPPLLLHLHTEFADTRGLIIRKIWKRIALSAIYAASLYLAFHKIPSLLTDPHFDFLLPGSSLGPHFGGLLGLAMIWCGGWEGRFAREAPDKPQSYFHWFLMAVFIAGFLVVNALHLAPIPLADTTKQVLGTVLSLLPILPFTILIYLVQRHNFLQIGRQKNLLYAVSTTFLALLYLSLVRRLGSWFEPVLPPEASAAILLFVLVIFIEPLQRILGQTLRETAKREMELVQRVAQEIQEEAKHGDVPRLLAFVEERILTNFELSSVKLFLGDKAIAGVGTGSGNNPSAGGLVWKPPYFPILSGDILIGLLRAEPHGATISGDTRAALEFLCEQLPGALDLCRLIEEKLRLERELAERERLALVGQMAASISHNLKNPLGSMKTILQVQLENPELPESIRGETRMVLEEIGRLSTKLNQLLQFSRPAVRGGSAIGSCDVQVVMGEVTSVLSHEAERRGVRLQTQAAGDSMRVAVSAEALNDVVSNLVVNALEAAPRGGRVMVCASVGEDGCVLTVEDDGPGIPIALQEKILQPFFTTKPQGTGLGLAIVARRVAEFGGKVEWKSPAGDGKGTRFCVTLPLEEARKQ